ncbi:unnamed protein product [Bursaphelenchus okinawaensis]|uniref:17S U2 SnRNP complex component HTATSF1 n=1 Tax=Bursaphelenchus okinawaensis TaxID=465554 RepID=A0A811JS63_9BILA|nr:unnamed protein product [Bursaphelenchus okinawaensis]CAG9080749.1 unnamed protein product [Bursaphelenchus okinawaensis]
MQIYDPCFIKKPQEEDFQVEEEEEEPGQSTSASAEPERRLVDGKWLCPSANGFLEYVDNEWKLIPDQNKEELQTKWDQAQPMAELPQPTCEINGVKHTWNPTANSWIPDSTPDEDFLAQYYLSYPVNEEVVNKEGEEEDKKVDKKQKQAEKAALKRERAEEEIRRSKGWVEQDEVQNTKVYVSNLPTEINEDQFIEFMQKCGVIMQDPRNKKPKVKLYRDEEGNLKGDGICCYVKSESVQLALDILDGWNWDGKIVKVEKAKFEMKGEFDPSKKKKRLTAEQKKRFLEGQKRLFEWEPEKDRAYRPPSDCTVVMKNLFSLEEMDTTPELMFDLKGEVRQTAETFGTVKNLVLYDTNPEGVITVTYDNVESADLMVKLLNRIIKRGRKIYVETWDGKTKYRLQETEEEKERRARAWEQFLGEDDEDGTEETEGQV